MPVFFTPEYAPSDGGLLDYMVLPIPAEPLNLVFPEVHQRVIVMTVKGRFTRGEALGYAMAISVLPPGADAPWPAPTSFFHFEVHVNTAGFTFKDGTPALFEWLFASFPMAPSAYCSGYDYYLVRWLLEQLWHEGQSARANLGLPPAPSHVRPFSSEARLQP